MDVLNGMCGKILVAGMVGCGCLFLCCPLLTTVFVLILRWSPVLIPYHVFGGKENLMQLEAEGSLSYWATVTLDGAFLTEGLMVLLCAGAICVEVSLTIGLLSSAIT